MSLIQIYKPNAKTSGHALSVSVNASPSKKDGRGIYIELIKQTTWDVNTKRGTFSGGDKIKLKFNEVEIATIIDCVNSGREAKFFHDSGTVTTSIGFKPWGENGWSFSASQSGVSYLMGLTFGEAEYIKQTLEFCLREIVATDFYIEQEQFQNNSQ